MKRLISIILFQALVAIALSASIEILLVLEIYHVSNLLQIQQEETKLDSRTIFLEHLFQYYYKLAGRFGFEKREEIEGKPSIEIGRNSISFSFTDPASYRVEDKRDSKLRIKAKPKDFRRGEIFLLFGNSASQILAIEAVRRVDSEHIDIIPMKSIKPGNMFFLAKIRSILLFSRKKKSGQYGLFLKSDKKSEELIPNSIIQSRFEDQDRRLLVLLSSDRPVYPVPHCYYFENSRLCDRKLHHLIRLL